MYFRGKLFTTADSSVQKGKNDFALSSLLEPFEYFDVMYNGCACQEELYFVDVRNITVIKEK